MYLLYYRPINGFSYFSVCRGEKLITCYLLVIKQTRAIAMDATN